MKRYTEEFKIKRDSEDLVQIAVHNPGICSSVFSPDVKPFFTKSFDLQLGQSIALYPRIRLNFIPKLP